jgi:predicted branched-subunit amino acid permease
VAAGDWVEFRRGAAAMLPLLASYAPFACLVGIAVGESRSPVAAWSGVWLIFGGTAQLVALRCIDAGSGVLVAAISALVVNIRLTLYSATIAPHWRGTPTRARLVAAATIVDPTWLLASQRFARDNDSASGRRFYAGASTVMWFGWAAMVTASALAGNLIPAGLGLQLLAPLCFIAMIAPGARSPRGWACIAAAVVVSVSGSTLPTGAALLIAMPAGACAACVADRFVSRRGR